MAREEPRDLERVANRMWTSLRFVVEGKTHAGSLACSESHDFILKHRWLPEAWLDCKVPAWMKWWLQDFLGVQGIAGPFSPSEEDLEECEAIRSRWTYWGERFKGDSFEK